MFKIIFSKIPGLFLWENIRKINIIFIVYFLVSKFPRTIILTKDQFSKITKIKKQKLTDLVIPATSVVTSTSEVNTQLTFPSVEIDQTKSRCNPSTTLQYNQV